MLPFRAHVRRQGSRWAWEVRQGRGATNSRRAGTAATRSEAIRAAFRPTPARAGQEPPAHQARQQAA
ncbi:hypothetical protein [Hymenobacter sp. PAMC 26628]|uniref:hypothetical protein n=1 Tax=Hymenobacter sp. PAMC 26628 TaxID=1484118 RepID=UPI0007706288|nr:hypothetical protein [Hymenobacter sp. PAMC 26628]AMJ64010.1 hypothetical protein AXW84_00145 [Hymenobacter sp. PAMC 26628]